VEVGVEGGIGDETEGMAAEVTPEVRAAGGVVWRVDDDAGLLVLVVHRPGYEDWTFPKGKTDPEDQDDEHTALREVEEESGLRCSLGHELPGTDYIDRKGHSKHVRYWEMRVLSGEFVPNREVDEARWLDLDAARQLLTYEHDRDVLDAFGVFAGDGWPRTG
jgi:8-oxo-dGTP pyrophosphatase MutT (NUDIX family)